ncbi:MAG: hypothetical protein ACLFT0_13810 [Spirulinaceae cyanobacterium]
MNNNQSWTVTKLINLSKALGASFNAPQDVVTDNHSDEWTSEKLIHLSQALGGYSL